MSKENKVNGGVSIAETMQERVYVGTKTIKAFPMSRSAYCKYRGWDLPADEDGNEMVYLVEYEVDPSSKPNHPDHEGYISMSPKHVFDKAYRKAGNYMDRLIIEKHDLLEKTKKLREALQNKKVPQDQEDILTAQLGAMITYGALLDMRINTK